MRTFFCIVPAVLVVALVAAGPACVGSDADVAPSSAGTDGGGTDAAGCGANEKACDGRCVSKDDPLVGCAAATCAPCTTASSANTTAACVDGACKTACVKGFDDCYGSPADGCEAKVETELTNCGKCGNLCGTEHATGRTCRAGACEITCEPAWLKCGRDAEGCNTNVTQDPKNCGACGRDCVGGTCTDKQCSVVTLAASQSYPRGLAVDATAVTFVTNDGKLKTVNKNGTGLHDLVGGLLSPQAVASDGTRIVWSNYDDDKTSTLERGSIATGFLSMRAVVGPSYGTFHGYLALAGDTIFWTNAYGDDPILRAPFAGGNAVPVATGAFEADGIAVDATHVYWVAAKLGVFRQPMAAKTPCVVGTTCAQVATGAAFGLAVDANNVYFTDAAIAGTVRKVAKTGGAVTTLATAQPGPLAIATDGIHVYWGNTGQADGGTSVRRTKVGATAPCSASGCELVHDVAAPSAVVVDDAAVYWVDASPNGGVYKRAK